MISAVGYSENEFSIDDPGRLCRGRERWIELQLAAGGEDGVAEGFGIEAASRMAGV